MKTPSLRTKSHKHYVRREVVHKSVFGILLAISTLSPTGIVFADEGTRPPTPAKAALSLLESCEKAAKVALTVIAHSNGVIEFTGSSSTKVLGDKQAVVTAEQAQSLLRQAEEVVSAGKRQNRASANNDDSSNPCLNITVHSGGGSRSKARKLRYAANKKFVHDFMLGTGAAQWACPARLFNVPVAAKRPVATVCYPFADSRIGYIHRRLSENCLIAEAADIYDEGTVHHYMMRNWNLGGEGVYVAEEYQQLSPKDRSELLEVLRSLQLPKSEPLTAESQFESRTYRFREGGKEQAESIWKWLDGRTPLQQWPLSGVTANCNDAGPPSHIQVDERFLQ
jgi:hypothetical protein